jgi:hypothetical protein
MQRLVFTLSIWFFLSHPQILNDPFLPKIGLLVQIAADISDIRANRSNSLIAKRKRGHSHKNS